MGVLDKAITVPGIGIRITLKGALQMICQVADIDQNLCRLITSRPEQACTELFSKYGEPWIKSQLDKAFYVLIGSTIEAIGCPKASNWQDIVLDAIDVELTTSGVSFDIDLEALAKSAVCAIANKAIVKPFGAVVATLTRELKNACKQLSASSSASSSSSSSAGSGASGGAFVLPPLPSIADRIPTLGPKGSTVRPSAPGTSVTKRNYWPLVAALALTSGVAVTLYRSRR